MSQLSSFVPDHEANAAASFHSDIMAVAAAVKADPQSENARTLLSSLAARDQNSDSDLLRRVATESQRLLEEIRLFERQHPR